MVLILISELFLRSVQPLFGSLTSRSSTKITGLLTNLILVHEFEALHVVDGCEQPSAHQPFPVVAQGLQESAAFFHRLAPLTLAVQVNSKADEAELKGRIE